jgi:hypothetical protein
MIKSVGPKLLGSVGASGAGCEVVMVNFRFLDFIFEFEMGLWFEPQSSLLMLRIRMVVA